MVGQVACQTGKEGHEAQHLLALDTETSDGSSVHLSVKVVCHHGGCC